MKARPTGYVLTGNKIVERETTQNYTLNYYELYITVLDAVLRYV